MEVFVNVSEIISSNSRTLLVQVCCLIVLKSIRHIYLIWGCWKHPADRSPPAVWAEPLSSAVSLLLIYFCCCCSSVVVLTKQQLDECLLLSNHTRFSHQKPQDWNMKDYNVELLQKQTRPHCFLTGLTQKISCMTQWNIQQYVFCGHTSITKMSVNKRRLNSKFDRLYCPMSFPISELDS